MSVHNPMFTAGSLAILFTRVDNMIGKPIQDQLFHHNFINYQAAVIAGIALAPVVKRIMSAANSAPRL